MIKIHHTPYGGNNNDIEDLASFVRDKLAEKLPTKPINEFLTKAVELMKGQIHYSKNPFNLEDDGGSLVIHPDKTFDIFLSPVSSPLRDNFTIAHELGHLILHYPRTNEVEKHTYVFTRYGSNIVEWQANRFAAALLMPRELFLQKATEFRKDTQKLSSFFEVSLPAVEIRLSYVN